MKTEADINTSPNWLHRQMNYPAGVDLKQEELETAGKEQPQLYRQFTGDIEQLEQFYKALKNQLTVSPIKEMLIETMIRTCN